MRLLRAAADVFKIHPGALYNTLSQNCTTYNDREALRAEYPEFYEHFEGILENEMTVELDLSGIWTKHPEQSRWAKLVDTSNCDTSASEEAEVDDEVCEYITIEVVL